jgi:hypothetical protein
MKPARQNRIFIVIATIIFICGAFVFPNQLYAEKEWTIMVYMGADNNLESAAIDDINEMEWIGSTDNSNILVQIDRVPGYDYSNGDWTSTRRYYITYDQEDLNQINSLLIADLGEKNMGDPQTLLDFIDWAIDNYPAENYFLILWDHGSGWHKDTKKSRLDNLEKILHGSGKPIEGEKIGELHKKDEIRSVLMPESPFEQVSFKLMCSDETDSDHLFNDEIQSVLENFAKIDILGFDACLMGMIEVAFEFKDHAHYMIASEENEPNDGWPYDWILYELYNNPLMSPMDLCSTVVDRYAYVMSNESGYDQTLSAIDLNYANQLGLKINEFCSEIMNSGVYAEVIYYLGLAERFGDKLSHYDLYDIADLAYQNLSGQNIKDRSLELKTAIEDAIIYEWHEYEHPGAHGLSIYFPQTLSAFELEYLTAEIDFPDSTNWFDFLGYYWGYGGQIVDVPEPNDTMTQAGLPLDPSMVYESYISSIGDFDCWLINSGFSEEIEINLQVPYNADFDMFLYPYAQASPLAYSYNSGNGVDETIIYNSQNAEFYSLVIAGIGTFSNQPYQLSIDQNGHDKGWFPVSYDDGFPYSGYYSETMGDALGVTFSLPKYPMTVEKLWINVPNIDCSGSGGDGSFYLLFWDNYGEVIDPFDLGKLYPTVEGWNYLDLSDENIKIYSNFFVGIMYDGINTPCIGYDDYFRAKDYYYSSNDEEWYYVDGSLFFRIDVSYPEVYLCGDANNDGAVNVSDAVWIINYVFVGGPEPDPFLSGEVNCDGAVNVSDAVWLINYVFVGGNDPCDSDPGSPNGDGIPDC